MIAHGGGIDDLAIFLSPIVIGVGFWLLTRQRKHADDEGQDGRPDDGASKGEPTGVSARRKGGAAHLRGLMDDDADPATPRDGHTRPESR